MYLIWAFLLFPVQLSDWDLLSTVEIEMGFDEFMAAEIEKPVFSSQLLEYEGSTVSLDGFVIPLQQASEQGYFVLSRFPYQSCFFCGAAGPETVVEVYSNDQYSNLKSRVRVEGTLRLNRDNPLHLFFILDDANVETLD